MKFDDIKNNENIYLYAGDIINLSKSRKSKSFIGLSLKKNDKYHIQHDITRPLPLSDDSVDIYQSEDVMEHIEYNKLASIIDEIYRVLKPGGLFRLSMPDYRCALWRNRSRKDRDGNIIFDPGGGGSYDWKTKKVIGGGHVWFPIYETVLQLLENTPFTKENIHFLHYYPLKGNQICKDIDYSLGFVGRTPAHDTKRAKGKVLSIVVDCYKEDKDILT